MAVKSIVVSNSPVEFAIMAPGGSHRRAIIRSDGPNLDLIGLDNTAFPLVKSRKSRSFLASLLRRRDISMQGYLVRSSPMFGIEDKDSNLIDERMSYLSFAWRGLASPSDIEDISLMFRLISIDLVFETDITIYNNDYDTSFVEWQIAPIISRCHIATQKEVRRGNINLALFALVGIVYFALLVAVVDRLPIFNY